MSPGLGLVLSGVTVIDRSDVGVTDGFWLEPVTPVVPPGPVGPVAVVPVLTPDAPAGVGVGVVVVAVLFRLPVAPVETLPVMIMVEVAPAGKSASVAVPFHEPVAPVVPSAPTMLYCGFCTLLGTVSETLGDFAAAGPLLATVIV